MPFEGVVCPVCQADKECTQVEEDTFYCPFHKGLFKYVDPRRFKVQVEGSFCACGNTAEFQCQVCESVLLCRECDLSAGSTRPIAVPVVGFGYEVKIENYFILALQGSRLVRLGDGSAVGLFLFLDDIIPQVETLAGGAVRHLCRSCAGAAVPAAAQAIADGYICEQPSCGRASQNRCRCCKANFCDSHLSSEARARRAPGERLWWTEEICWGLNPDGTALHWGATGGNIAYIVPFLSGICDMCTSERKSDMQGAIESIITAHLGGDSVLIQGFPTVGHSRLVPTRKMPLAFLQEIENRRAKKIAEECAEAVRAKLNSLERLPGACRRDEWFTDVRVSGQVVSSSLYYRVIDDRKRRAPAAVSEPGRR